MAYVIMRQRQAAVCMFVPTPIKVIEAYTKEAKKYIDDLNKKSSVYSYYKVKVPMELL